MKLKEDPAVLLVDVQCSGSADYECVFDIDDVQPAKTAFVRQDLYQSLALKVKRLCEEPASGDALSLARTVQTECANIPRSSVTLLHTLGSRLAHLHGASSRCRHCLGPRTTQGYLRNLRHSFLIVSTSKGSELVVDPWFKENFSISNPPGGYHELMRAIPEHFVGTLDVLLAVLSIVHEGIRLAFLELRRPLPPWREARSILSMWASDNFYDEPVGGRGLGRASPSPSLSYLNSAHGSYKQFADMLKPSSAAFKKSNGTLRILDAIPACIQRGFEVPGLSKVDKTDKEEAGPTARDQARNSYKVATRGYRSLDQLLPVIRTVRLGAG